MDDDYCLCCGRLIDPCPRCQWPAEPDEIVPTQIALSLQPDGWRRHVELTATMVKLQIRDGLKNLRS